MQKLHFVDITVLVLYISVVVLFGALLARKSRTVVQFTSAGGSIPGWAVGLSLFGTFLSSLTFLGVPGKAYGSNWNSFIFSMTLPIAAIIAVKYFIPFYRNSKQVSAYTHLESRFGSWARTYTMLCYLLTQIARIGAILFGVGLVLKTLLGWDMSTTILVTGSLVIFYTLLGGIEAVVWTDVVQSIVLIAGAIISLGILIFDMPEGPGQILTIAHEHHKTSLGDFNFNLSESTVWVVFMFGIFINLNNFGIDQDQVQRYHVAKSDREASRAVWIMAILYVPVSLLFFFIGTSLFSYYEVHPELLNEIKHQVAADRLNLDLNSTLTPMQGEEIQNVVNTLEPDEIGDKVFPHFIVNRLPTGMVGLLVAAIIAAAMSSIDTSLNCSATIILKDYYSRYIDKEPSEKNAMRVLHYATIIWGVLGTGTAILLIGTRSLLDAWWVISGILTGGMLGLFLLGFISRRADNMSAKIALIAGLVVILWMTISLTEIWPENLGFIRSPFHANMIAVIGTSTIFLVGILVTFIRKGMQK
jgi:solute:Na+ symporter, SSS family